MIDEKKVRYMTDIVMFEEGKDRRTAVFARRFFGSDFVAVHVIKGIIAVTAAYVTVIGCIVLARMEELLTEYPLNVLLRELKYAGLLYLGVLAVSVIIMFYVYTSKYWRSRESLLEYRRRLKKLRSYYRNSAKNEDKK